MAKCAVVFVAFETLRPPSAPVKEGQGAKYAFVKARGKGIVELQKEIQATVAGIGGSKCPSQINLYDNHGEIY